MCIERIMPSSRYSNGDRSPTSEVSYGIYLYHLIVLWLLVLYLGIASGPLLFVTVLMLTTWIAAVSYRFFELPFLRLKRRGQDIESVPAGMPSAAPV